MASRRCRWSRARQAGALALDEGTCTQILDECGFLPTRGLGVVNLCEIPDGLNTGELQRYLREHGAELRLGRLLILEWTPCEIRGIQTGAPWNASADSAPRRNVSGFSAAL